MYRCRCTRSISIFHYVLLFVALWSLYISDTKKKILEADQTKRWLSKLADLFMGRGLTKLHNGRIRARNVTFANGIHHTARTWVDAALSSQVWQCGLPKPLRTIPQRDL